MEDYRTKKAVKIAPHLIKFIEQRAEKLGMSFDDILETALQTYKDDIKKLLGE